MMTYSAVPSRNAHVNAEKARKKPGPRGLISRNVRPPKKAPKRA